MTSVHYMPINRTGFPFGFSHDDFEAEQRFREFRDLLGEIEVAQLLALDAADLDDGTRDYLEHQIPVMVDEAKRRRQLLQRRRDDPFAPSRPSQHPRLDRRVAAVKARWPIERFCRDLLLMDLIPAGGGKWKARCPYPGHVDRNPSFVIYTRTDTGFCFRCQRGGDVIKLCQYVRNLNRFMDALEALEREGGLR
jgi:hypothetical protein